MLRAWASVYSLLLALKSYFIDINGELIVNIFSVYVRGRLYLCSNTGSVRLDPVVVVVAASAVAVTLIVISLMTNDYILFEEVVYFSNLKSLNLILTLDLDTIFRLKS